MIKDKRYTITKEFTGNFNNIGQPDFVLRFCDEFISAHIGHNGALEALEDHQNEREKEL